MTTVSPRIVFMGTPEFSVPSLEALLTAGFHVAGVVTAPDKPSGRGLKLTPSPVKVFAVKHGLKVLQPVNLKSPEFLKELTDLQPDLQVVVAFRMLPEAVWKLPRLGTFNLHASLLPQYRGAAPINWSIINGDTETGITTFLLQHEIDTGAVLFRERTPIGPEETAGELHDRLMEMGSDLVVRTVTALVSGKAQPVSQENIMEVGTVLRPAPKLNRDNIRIDWNKPATQVHNLIRGLSPYPAAYTLLHGNPEDAPLQFKIIRARPVAEVSATAIAPGTLIADRSTLRVATADGLLDILELQPAGKPRMSVKDFLNGFRLSASHRFE
jgi:methionyl-tRNA formyltransferase